MKSPNYLESVATAFSEAKAWRAATFVLGLVCVILAYQLVAQVRNRPVVLVPYNAASRAGSRKVISSA